MGARVLVGVGIRRERWAGLVQEASWADWPRWARGPLLYSYFSFIYSFLF